MTKNSFKVIKSYVIGRVLKCNKVLQVWRLNILFLNQINVSFAFRMNPHLNVANNEGLFPFHLAVLVSFSIIKKLNLFLQIYFLEAI